MRQAQIQLANELVRTSTGPLAQAFKDCLVNGQPDSGKLKATLTVKGYKVVQEHAKHGTYVRLVKDDAVVGFAYSDSPEDALLLAVFGEMRDGNDGDHRPTAQNGPGPSVQAGPANPVRRSPGAKPTTR